MYLEVVVLQVLEEGGDLNFIRLQAKAELSTHVSTHCLDIEKKAGWILCQGLEHFAPFLLTMCEPMVFILSVILLSSFREGRQMLTCQGENKHIYNIIIESYTIYAMPYAIHAISIVTNNHRGLLTLILCTNESYIYLQYCRKAEISIHTYSLGQQAYYEVYVY